MQPAINKRLIKARFKKSLVSYDIQASVQKSMASSLISYLIKEKGDNFLRILEIGCGTGILTREINKSLNFNMIYVNDIVEESKQYLPTDINNLKFIVGDAEQLEFPDKCDLVISNATFQWISDLSGFLEKISNSLSQGGILAFSGFGPENIKEIATVSNHSLLYRDKESILSTADDFFEILYYDSEKVKLYFDKPIDVLKHLKQTGVNAIQQSFWTRKDIRDFEEKYQSLFREQDKIYLTYQPTYFILEKK